jgi:hypothetical protein
METEIETAKPRSRRNGKLQELPRWWDGLVHPMSDAAFYDAFCAWVLINSTDHSLRTVRDRAYRFIRQIMRPEMDRHLAEYRAEYPE